LILEIIKMDKEIVIFAKIGNVNGNVSEKDIFDWYSQRYMNIEDKIKNHNAFCVYETNKTKYVVVFDKYIIDSISLDAIIEELNVWEEKARDYNYERYKHLIEKFFKEFDKLKEKKDIVGIFRLIKEVYDYLSDDAFDYVNSKKNEIEKILREKFKKNENIRNLLFNEYMKKDGRELEKFQISLNVKLFEDELIIDFHLICYNKGKKFWSKWLKDVRLSYDEITDENIADFVYKKMLLEKV